MGCWRTADKVQRNDAGSLQKLLPNQHLATRLFTQRAHQAGHRGRDATLARFRIRYWPPHGNKLARSVKMNCQLCKLREANFLERQMGLLPEARLKPAPAFNHIMLDLFSPYMVRREVQKRTNGKEYGVMFTDLAVRAVHIERCLDMTQAISRWLSAGLQVSVDGRRKFTMIQFLNLWV